MTRSALSGCRFLLLVTCISSATGAVLSDSEGQPPHCDSDNVPAAVSGSAMDDMVHCSKVRLAAESQQHDLFLDTDTLRHQLLREVVEAIERGDRLQNDTRSLQAQTTDALAHLRSVVSEQSSSSAIEMQQTELHARLAVIRASVGAGMALVESSYRSQGDAVDRLREMLRCRLELTGDVDGHRRARGQNDDDDLHGFLAQVRAVEESMESRSMSMLKAHQGLGELHAEISAAMDQVLVLVKYSARSCNYSLSRSCHIIRLDG